jgi:DNA-binding PadR family transcriptional regulator
MSKATHPEQFIPLAPHIFQILLSVLQEPRHPYAILKDIEDRSDGEMVLGTSTVYSAINRMVRQGLLREVDDPGEEASGGPRRRYYAMTELGHAVGRAEGLRIERLHRLVEESALLGGRGVRPQEAGS